MAHTCAPGFDNYDFLVSANMQIYGVMKTGDRVKLVGIPPDVRGEDDMQTRTIFDGV
jgi:hypothetical protein